MGSEADANEVSVKWSGALHQVSLDGLETLGDFQARLFTLLDVRPPNQKLLGLKLKGSGALAKTSPETPISSLQLGPKSNIILMGQPDHILEQQKQQHLKSPESETGEEGEEEEEDPNCPNALREIFQAKIARRVREYSVEELAPLRGGKRLLVLDIDYTLYDHRSEAESIHVLMRPHLHVFLAAVYARYDIVIWSATGMKWIKAKLKEMQLLDRAEWKFAFFLDANAMISIHTEALGLREVKPLRVIWDKFPQSTSPANTIMLDDVGTNFFMNPKNGLKIRPYKRAHINQGSDEELLGLAKYLEAIAEREPDFTRLNHAKWRRYLEKL